MRPNRFCQASLLLLLAATTGTAAESEPEWSKEVPVRSGTETVLRLRARIAGEYLVVQAIHTPGWHSYAMDNDLREQEKLAGKASLGTEQGLRIHVESGGKPQGPWYQSPPADLSQAELRHYTWGFDGTATFALRLKPSGSDPVVLAIGGQVCNSQTCRIIDVELTVPHAPDSGREGGFSTDDLVPVRTGKGADSPSSPPQKDSL